MGFGDQVLMFKVDQRHIRTNHGANFTRKTATGINDVFGNDVAVFSHNFPFTGA